MIGCALGIIFVIVYLLLGGVDAFQASAPVHVYLRDLSGLQNKSAVQFNGIQVGEVSHFQLSGLNDPNRAVRVDMLIYTRYLAAIPEDSTVEVTALNLLDEQFVNINEGTSPRHIMPGTELRPSPPPAINPAQIMAGGRQILAQLDAVVRDMETGQGAVGHLVRGDEIYNSILRKVSEFQRAVQAAANKNTLTGRLIFDDSYYDRLESPVKKLDRSLADLEAGQGSLGKFLKDPAQYQQLRKSVGDLNRALGELNAGKGTTGRLLKDDELYRRINRLVETLIEQIDGLNYGETGLGELLVNSSLYETLSGSTKSLEEMMRALRQNPRKMLRPKIF